jgi:ADP-ribose pyrophosphatase YjhB (NUDIX family)
LTKAVVFNRNQELLVQHSLTPETDFYRLPGGHVRFREKLEDCVVRELREEIKLKGKQNVYFGFGTSWTSTPPTLLNSSS